MFRGSGARPSLLGTDAMTRRWTIHPHHAERISFLQRAANVPAVVAQLLLCRGLEQPEAVR